MKLRIFALTCVLLLCGFKIQNGGLVVTRKAVGAGDYTVLTSDYLVAKTASTSGGDTVSLPPAASVEPGRTFVVKDETGSAVSNPITIVADDGNEQIEGFDVLDLDTNYAFAEVYSSGSSWYVSGGTGVLRTTLLWEADFSWGVLGAQLPECTTGVGCIMQCSADVSANWNCVDGDGNAYTVSQGVGATADTNPWDLTRYHLVDVTNTSCPTLDPTGNSVLENVWNGPHTVLMTGASSERENATYQYAFEQADLRFYMRQEGHFRAYWTTPNGSIAQQYANRTFENGWQFFGARKAGDAATSSDYSAVVANGINTPTTHTGDANWNPAVGATGLWSWGCRTSSATLALRGPLESFTLYDEAKSDAFIKAQDARWRGLYHNGIGINYIYANTVKNAVDDLAGGYAVANGGPAVVDSGGLQLYNRVAQVWSADALDATSWAVEGTPVVTADTGGSGLFTKWNPAWLLDTVEDDDPVLWEGVASATVTSPATGLWTMSCLVKAGSISNARLSMITDGTGSLDCDEPLSGSVERYSCTADVGGSPTQLTAKLLVGSANTDTGTILVDHCQLEDGPGPRTVKLNNAVPDQYNKGLTEADANSIGADLTSDGSVEFVFSINRTEPDAETSVSPFYPFDWANAGLTNHAMLCWKYDDTRPFTCRITNDPCMADLDFSDVEVSAGGGAGVNFAADTFYVVKFTWVDEGSTLGEYLYLDECIDPDTCTATTLVGSATGQCKGDQVKGPLYFGQRFTGGGMDGVLRRWTIRSR